ncbi:hypothetical protein BU601_13170, partial [Staphylococcus arlettae]
LRRVLFPQESAQSTANTIEKSLGELIFKVCLPSIKQKGTGQIPGFVGSFFVHAFRGHCLSL